MWRPKSATTAVTLLFAAICEPSCERAPSPVSPGSSPTLPPVAVASSSSSGDAGTPRSAPTSKLAYTFETAKAAPGGRYRVGDALFAQDGNWLVRCSDACQRVREVADLGVASSWGASGDWVLLKPRTDTGDFVRATNVRTGQELNVRSRDPTSPTTAHVLAVDDSGWGYIREDTRVGDTISPDGWVESLRRVQLPAMRWETASLPVGTREIGSFSARAGHAIAALDYSGGASRVFGFGPVTSVCSEDCVDYDGPVLLSDATALLSRQGTLRRVDLATGHMTTILECGAFCRIVALAITPSDTTFVSYEGGNYSERGAGVVALGDNAKEKTHWCGSTPKALWSDGRALYFGDDAAISRVTIESL